MGKLQVAPAYSTPCQSKQSCVDQTHHHFSLLSSHCWGGCKQNVCWSVPKQSLVSNFSEDVVCCSYKHHVPRKCVHTLTHVRVRNTRLPLSLKAAKWELSRGVGESHHASTTHRCSSLRPPALVVGQWLLELMRYRGTTKQPPTD